MSFADGVQPVVLAGAGGRVPPAIISAALATTAVAADSTTAIVAGTAGQTQAMIGWRVSVAGGAASAGYVRLVSSSGDVLSEDVQVPTTGVVEAGDSFPGGASLLIPEGDGFSIYSSAAFTLSVVVRFATSLGPGE